MENSDHNLPKTRWEILRALHNGETEVIRTRNLGRLYLVVKHTDTSKPPEVVYRAGRAGEEVREFQTLDQCFEHLDIKE